MILSFLSLQRMHSPTFFGTVIPAEFRFRTLLKDVLVLTRATIDPSAPANAHSRLILSIDKDVAPIAEVDGQMSTTVPLNIQLMPGVDIEFTVRGNAPVHLVGFYEPIGI